MTQLRVALFQTDPIWQIPEKNMQRLAQQMQQVGDCDLMVLPEMFTAGFGSDAKQFAEECHGPTYQWLKAQAAKHSCAICGSFSVHVENGVANRLVWCHADGNTHHYDKRHLFRMAGEHKRYISGSEKLLLNYCGWRINPQICYDLRFPVWCRNRSDFDLQIFVANWPAARRHAWRTLLQARAIENQAYVIGVNRTGVDGKGLEYSGDSLIVDPMGEIVVDANDKPGVFTATLDLACVQNHREQFPTHLDADKFEIHYD